MNAPSAHESEWIINTTQDSFEQDVFERSKRLPVVVDFWATWCAPCRMLGPILEKLADESAGRFLLVKADTEQVPNAAATFRVQSIPAVFAVLDGQVVDGFVGVMPEPQLREWLERIMLAGDLQRAHAIEATEPEEARQIYMRLHERDPDRAETRIALARLALQQGDTNEARDWLTQLEERGFLEPEAQKLRAALDLEGKKDVDLASLRDAAGRAPDNMQVQLQLAEALAAQQQYQEALDRLLSIVERDRKGAGEQARVLMIDIFRVLPDDSELTASYRRKLSSLLY